MINLPAAGYRPRAFGEADYCDGPPQGAAIVELRQNDFEVTYKTVTEAEFTYPRKARQFDDKAYALWLVPKFELPCKAQFRNGQFTQGLSDWQHNWVYLEDENPANICEVRPVSEASSMPYLHLRSRKRGFETPGQDRLPQSINQITQALDIRTVQTPLIELEYRIPRQECDFQDISLNRA